MLSDYLKGERTEEEIYKKLFEIIKESGVSSKEFFRVVYMVLLGKPWGPRLAPFILIIGRDRIRKNLDV